MSERISSELRINLITEDESPSINGAVTAISISQVSFGVQWNGS